MFLIGSLYPAFGHARIGIAQAQFRGHEDLGSMAGRFNGRCRTGSTAADDQDVRFKLDMVYIDVASSIRLLPCKRTASSDGT